VEIDCTRLDQLLELDTDDEHCKVTSERLNHCLPHQYVLIVV
jgi:hypothetical protein